MDDNTKCVLVFLIAIVGLGTVFYLLLTQGGTKGQTLNSVIMAFSRAKTPSQKIFAFFVSFWILLKTGAWGAFTAITWVLVNGVVAICGQNLLPFYLEVWDRLTAIFTKQLSVPQPPA